MERAVALADHQILDVDDLPPAIASVSQAADSAPAGSTEELSTTDLEDIERTTIERVFQQVKGDKALAGKMLGISRATLYRKLKRYNIGGRIHAISSQALQ
jgi:transcriptional regulator of acetoin/glycerol metabolism